MKGYVIKASISEMGSLVERGEKTTRVKVKVFLVENYREKI